MYDLGNARKWAQRLREEALFPGAVVVDATMGNGGDTAHLAQLVGENGHVYAFDVQQEALDRTAERLKEAGLSARVTLILDGHQNMLRHIKTPCDMIVFNLGWLPGAAHDVFTLAETTMRALDAALALLKVGALLTVCVYPGHEEGTRELHALLEWAAALDEKRFDAMHKTYLNQSNDPPHLIAVKKKLTRRQKGTGK